MSAGDLRYRVGFYQRGSPAGGSPPPPDYGNPIGPFPGTANFIVFANINERPGGEQVLAARLTGKNFVNITVRQSPDTDQIDTDWMAKNEDSGETFNVRSVIDPDSKSVRHGFYWEILCEKGVAV